MLKCIRHLLHSTRLSVGVTLPACFEGHILSKLSRHAVYFLRHGSFTIGFIGNRVKGPLVCLLDDGGGPRALPGDFKVPDIAPYFGYSFPLASLPLLLVVREL